MATNTRQIVEQLQRRLSSGNPSVAKKTNHYELRKAVEQALNSLLRPQYFQTLQGSESIPEGNVIAFYSDVAVTAYNGISKSKLPAIPVTLPKDMGVWRISATGDPLQDEFIPIPKGQFGNVVKQRLISDLLGQIGYEVKGNEVWYTKDLTAQSPAINAVNMELVVADFSNYTDYEILPINADLEAQVIEMVYKQFAGTPPQTNIVDTTSDSKN